MIGSQATKDMHVLARFAPQIERGGVRTDGRSLKVIETYPITCKRSARMAQPEAHIDSREGWIFVPVDGLGAAPS